MTLFGKEFQTIRVIFFLLGIAVCVVADLIIKAQVEKNLARLWDQDLIVQNNETLLTFVQDPKKERILVKEIVVIEDFWSFTYIRNYNVGFSSLRFIENYLSPSSQKLFFQIFQLIAVALVISYFLFYGTDQPYPFLLILSGGLGNVIDRWQRGYVIDYVKWYIKDSPIEIFNPWPIFNLADSLITVGVGLLLISMFSNKKSNFSKKDENQTEKPI